MDKAIGGNGNYLVSSIGSLLPRIKWLIIINSLEFTQKLVSTSNQKYGK